MALTAQEAQKLEDEADLLIAEVHRAAEQMEELMENHKGGPDGFVPPRVQKQFETVIANTRAKQDRVDVIVSELASFLKSGQH